MADKLTVHQRNVIVTRTPLYNQHNFVRDDDGFSSVAPSWTGSKFEVVPNKSDVDYTESCSHQLLDLLMKNPHWKGQFRRSALSEKLNIVTNPPYGFNELEQADKTMPKFSEVTKLHWHFFNKRCMEKLQAENTNKYQFDWPYDNDHGSTVNPEIVFGINTRVMNENLAMVRSHQITDEQKETHRPYRQLSHRLSKQAAAIPSIRSRHDPSVVATSLLQDAVVMAHLTNAVKLTPAADLLKIIIMGSPLEELFKRTVYMILIAEMTYLPQREDIKTIPLEMILKNMESQLLDKIIRQFVSSILMNATPVMLDGFAWRSIYLSRDKKKVLENIRDLQNSMFQLRPGVSMIDIQLDVEKLFTKLMTDHEQHKVALESVYNVAKNMITDNRYYDKAATVLADCLYTINYEPTMLITRHIWLLADAPLHRRLQQILKDKLTVPSVPIMKIMATNASLVAVTTVMNEAEKVMRKSIILDLYNPQVFIGTNETIRAIADRQQEWSMIRPEMAATVGDLAVSKNATVYCTLNFEQNQGNPSNQQGITDSNTITQC